MGITMLKKRRSRDPLIIFNMGIPILVRLHLYIYTAPGRLLPLLLWYDKMIFYPNMQKQSNDNIEHLMIFCEAFTALALIYVYALY